MLPFALNHMTMPAFTTGAVLDTAQSLGCVGVELRNDLANPLFDDADPVEIRDLAASKGQQILALAEVSAFNHDPGNMVATVAALATKARACGAPAIVLIPQMGTQPIPRDMQREALVAALRILQPVLEDHGIVGLIEPLGFANSSLRHKEDAVAALDDLGCPSCFALIHDTFHHALAGGGALYPDQTKIVHISGVTNPVPSIIEMTDADRGLVGADDRLGTVAQLSALHAAGYRGPASFEAFAPATHRLADPAKALAASIAFITTQLSQPAQACA